MTGANVNASVPLKNSNKLLFTRPVVSAAGTGPKNEISLGPFGRKVLVENVPDLKPFVVV